MKRYLSLFILIPAIFFTGASISLAANTATDGIGVHLGVDGCNNNNVCEPSIGEDTLTCPNDCSGGGGGGGGGGEEEEPAENYFYDVAKIVTGNNIIITWKSHLRALATLKWGQNTDYSDGSLSESSYITTHSTELNNLLYNTRYYFLIEGNNANNTAVTPYSGFFDISTLFDIIPPGVVRNFTAQALTTSIKLSWTNPVDADFNYVRLMRNNFVGNTNPFDGQLLYEGSGETFTDTNVIIFRRYYYTIFARDTSGNFSNGVEANAMINPIEIDVCDLYPFSCEEKLPDPCVVDPSSCAPALDPCKVDPSSCVPPSDPCKVDPSSCTPSIKESILPEVIGILDSSTTKKAVVDIATIAVGASTLLTLVGSILANAFSFGEISLVLMRLWSLLLIALGLKKRTQPWGVVYDSVTKQPLDPAYVVLMDKDGNEVATCITDLDGRYGFMVEPGVYRIVASKTNYAYPSQKLSGKIGDEVYGQLYFGTEIEVTESGAIIASNIPLDPLHFDWNEFAKKDQHLMKFFKQRDVWLGRFSSLLFKAGFILSIYMTIVSPTGYNIAILGLSVALYALRSFGLHSQSKGSISDRQTKQPLPFSVIRVRGLQTGEELLHKVADRTGRYYAIMPNGTYRVSIDMKNPDESYTRIDINEPISVTKGYLKKNFKV